MPIATVGRIESLVAASTVRASEMVEYQEFVMKQLSQIPGVRNVKTEIPLETVKKTTGYPL
jgi:DNA-binding Lrp family transcriptional regulator